MSIDVNALRLFQATWGPVLDAIPTVIDAIGRQADFDRELKLKAMALDDANKEIESVYAEADKRLQAINNQMTEAINARFANEAAIEKAKRDAADAADEAAKAQNAVLADIAEKIAAKNAELSAVDAEIAAKTAAAQAEHEAVVAKMAAEVADLEKRQAVAEKALESLRAKLG